MQLDIIIMCSSYLCTRNVLVIMVNLLECMFLVTAGDKVNYGVGEWAREMEITQS